MASCRHERSPLLVRCEEVDPRIRPYLTGPNADGQGRIAAPEMPKAERNARLGSSASRHEPGMHMRWAVWVGLHFVVHKFSFTSTFVVNT